MSYKNFVPTVWAEAINRELERAQVFAEDCNRQYEGIVEKAGDTVRILGVGKPTITDTTDTNIVLEPAEKVEDTSIVLPVRHVSHFNYSVGDIDKLQATGNVMQALNAEASAGCADRMDKYIANLALEKTAKLHKASSEVLNADNVLDLLDAAAQMLYENDVPSNGKIVVTLPPWAYTRFRKAYRTADTNNSEILKHGKVAMYGNMVIKMSNNVAAAGADSRILVRTPKAIAFVNPKTHVEPYRPEKGFEDAVKGYVLYDAKIVRPKELVVLNVKQA